MIGLDSEVIRKTGVLSQVAQSMEVDRTSADKLIITSRLENGDSVGIALTNSKDSSLGTKSPDGSNKKMKTKINSNGGRKSRASESGAKDIAKQQNSAVTDFQDVKRRETG